MHGGEFRWRYCICIIFIKNNQQWQAILVQSIFLSIGLHLLWSRSGHMILISLGVHLSSLFLIVSLLPVTTPPLPGRDPRVSYPNKRESMTTGRINQVTVVGQGHQVPQTANAGTPPPWIRPDQFDDRAGKSDPGGRGEMCQRGFSYPLRVSLNRRKIKIVLMNSTNFDNQKHICSILTRLSWKQELIDMVWP